MKSEKRFDEIEQELLEMEENGQGSENRESGQEEIPGFNIQEIVYQIESIGNNYLKNINPKLAVPEEQLKMHSELLTVVINKNVSVEAVKNSPEFLLLGHTAIIGIGIWKKYEYLQEKGEL